MDWSKIKTIFILTFLVLDIYLLYEFLKLLDTNNYEYITETSFEENMDADNIEYVELPKNISKDGYVNAEQKIFKNEDYSKLKGQTFTIANGTLLQSLLTEPYALGGDFEQSKLNSFVKNKIPFGDQYEYFAINEDEKTVTYFQKYQTKPFYYNINGKITLQLNEKNEIISYKQTLLEEIEFLSEKQEVLPPIKAIETLYDNGELLPFSKITKVELGYFTLVQLSASQVLTPTWRFVVDDKENLFVNAIEGQIIQIEDKKTTSGVVD